MWPISIYEVTLTHAMRLERLVNARVRKWLGLPRCLTSIGTYGNEALSLPISSLVEAYKCAKTRLEMNPRPMCQRCSSSNSNRKKMEAICSSSHGKGHPATQQRGPWFRGNSTHISKDYSNQTLAYGDKGATPTAGF